MNRSNLISGLIGFVLGIGALLLFHSGTLRGGASASAGRAGTSGPNGNSGGFESSSGRSGKAGGRPGTEVKSAAQVVENLRESFLISNARSRRIKTAEYFANMTPENALMMRELFREFDKQGLRFDQEWGLLWHQWGKVDPKSALQQVDKEVASYPGFVTQVTGMIFSSWAEDDPLAARLHLEQIEDDQQFNAAFNGIVNGASLSEAVAIAEGTEYGDFRFASMAAETIAERTLREAGNTDALETWYDEIQNEELKEGALDHVAWRLKKRNLGLAAEWIRERASDGVDTGRIVGELARDFARKSGFDGLEWYLTLPNEVRKEGDFERLMAAAQAQGPEFEKWSSENRERLDAAARELRGE